MSEEGKKKSFLSKMPGFRSGKMWKKILASIGYFIILLLIIGILSPDKSTDAHVNDARKYATEGNYILAVSSYEKALKEWESATLTKEEIEKELKGAKAGKLLGDAIAAYGNGKADEAISKFNEAVSLAGDHPKIAEAKTKLEPALKAKTDGYISAAENSLEDWNITEAEKNITLLSSIAPDDERFKALKEQLDNAKSQIEEIGPRPVNSAWDAAVKPVQDFLKANLKDPNSVEYAEWSKVFSSSWEGQKCWAVRCKYRAKNSFGGYVLANQIFYIRNDMVIGYKDF